MSDQTKLLRLNDLANLYNTKVIGITESHLDDKHLDGEIQIQGYESIRSDRLKRKGGGVLLYVSNKFK